MFFLIPVGVDYRARRYPVVTFTLMGICIAVYLVSLTTTLVNGPEGRAWEFENLWLVPAESYWWSYLTSMFVHAGFFHLLGNMIYLFLFGSCVEDIIGRVHFTLFYLVCGIAAQFAYIAFSPNHFASEIPMGGASGAISACIGGFLVLLAKTRIEFKWVFFFFFRIWNGEFFMPAWLVISFWFVKDAAMMVLTAVSGTDTGGVAFGAHVGGTVVGLGWIALEKLRLKGQGDEDEDEVAQIRPQPVARTTARIRVTPKAQELTEPQTIYLFLNGSQAGPYALSNIEQMFAAGSLPADTLYWQEGMDEWRLADELRPPGAV